MRVDLVGQPNDAAAELLLGKQDLQIATRSRIHRLRITPDLDHQATVGVGHVG